MSRKGFINIILVIVVLLVAGGAGYYFLTNKAEAPLVETHNAGSVGGVCGGEDPGITQLSTSSVTAGEKMTVQGCNLAGFEGDLNLWIQNEKGEKGIVYGETGSTNSAISFVLKSSLCQMDVSYSGNECGSFINLTPGNYKIFAEPWGKKSNVVDFIIK